ncbi:MAG: PEP-CTERM sorting domain-containing protein [Minisyncoccota bacterium]
MKAKIALAALLCLGVLLPSMARANWIQPWYENGVGTFDAIGMVRVSGGAFASPGLIFNSGAPDWTEVNNADYAFASFSPTSLLYFTTDILSSPSQFAFYVWNGDTLLESDLVDSSLHVTTPYADGAPTRDQLFALSGGTTTVPEPGTLFLLGLGLVGLAFVVKRTNHSAAGTASA